MKLTGHVKFTLRDESGKIIRTEEDHNTITPALASIFNHNIAGTVDFTKLTPILTKLLGGVCLWNGSLDDTSIFLPRQTSAQLTAHAGQNQTGGIEGDTTKGELDTNEEGGSGPVENGYRWVWRWNQSQGNGRISGLTLCHADVGDFYHQIDNSAMTGFSPVEDLSNYSLNANNFSYSDGSPQVADLPKVVGITLPHGSEDPIHGLDTIPVGFYGDANHVVSIELVEDRQDQAGTGGGDWRYGHYNIYISKFTGTGLWLLQDLADLSVERTISVPVKWQWGNTTSLGRGIHYVAYDEEIKHLYVFTLGTPAYLNWYPQPTAQTFWYRWYNFDASFEYKDIDLETGTVTTKQSGSLGDMITGFVFKIHEEQYEPILLKVIDGKIIMPKYNAYSMDVQREIPIGSGHMETVTISDYEAIYRDKTSAGGVCVNMRTGEVTDFVRGPISSDSGNDRACSSQIALGNGRSMFPTSLIEPLSSQEGAGPIYTNYRSRSITRDNSIFGTGFRNSRLYTSQKSDSLIMFATLPIKNTSGDRLRGALLNKMYQASVYRLNSVVEKQPGQTMTVEYTILQDAEEQT